MLASLRIIGSMFLHNFLFFFTSRAICCWLGICFCNLKFLIVEITSEIISKSSDNSIYEEGCLSVPGQFAEIERPDKCHLKYLDYYGKPKELAAEGMLATCIQHEMDHLEGILFIDYLSKLKKSIIVKKLKKQKEQFDRIVI